MSRTKVQEIEAAIGSLTVQEWEELRAWLDRYAPPAEPIDLRIEADLAAGRLDAALDRALEDERQGRTRRL